jgi:hypothetical protein
MDIRQVHSRCGPSSAESNGLIGNRNWLLGQRRLNNNRLLFPFQG